MEKNNKEFANRQNQGEGNRTAAREYNEAQQRFVRSGKVDQKAREAARDMDKDTIRRELEHAETIGRRHSANEDPEVKRRY
jgi:hypothetical protein